MDPTMSCTSSGGISDRRGDPLVFELRFPIVNWTSRRNIGPPWLAVRHCEVDIVHKSSSIVEPAMGCTVPESNCQLPIVN
jgi:hypothetical protein